MLQPEKNTRASNARVRQHSHAPGKILNINQD